VPWPDPIQGLLQYVTPGRSTATAGNASNTIRLGATNWADCDSSSGSPWTTMKGPKPRFSDLGIQCKFVRISGWGGPPARVGILATRRIWRTRIIGDWSSRTVSRLFTGDNSQHYEGCGLSDWRLLNADAMPMTIPPLKQVGQNMAIGR
jgi:hypothetical protein